MKNSYIGLMAIDSPDLLIGILAILKSGNCFVPINPAFPEERIRFIIKDCNISLLLTDKTNVDKARQIVKDSLPVLNLCCVDDMTGIAREESEIEDEAEFAKKSRCYVIYTSGSTGRPKGVPIIHQNLAILFNYSREYLDLGIHSRVMQNLSYTFDFGVFEILSTLLFGGQLFVLNKSNISDFSYYLHFINLKQINTLHSTPVFINNLVDTGQKMNSIKLIHLGGEQLTGEVVKKIYMVTSPGCLLYNGYGPTETTINSTFFRLDRDRIEFNIYQNIPIGRPSDLHSIYILDMHLNLQPIGVVGELCIAGSGLSEGYLNRPELTEQKFLEVQKPFFKKVSGPQKKIIYRTGDLVRWLPDGNIEFLGRIDHQVKVRGFRIELGEIENRLAQHPDIKEVVVVARQNENSTNYLCAYIVTHSRKTLTVLQLREFLLIKLPDYMVPAYFIQLEKIPLTGTGKIDRNALAGPDETLIETGDEYVAPGTLTEKKLVIIWQQLLRLKKLGVNTDFFQVGGDSILVNQCIARIREELHVEIPMRKFFERPYIKALAEEIEKQERQVSSIKPVERVGEIPLSFAQERLWFLQELDSENVAYFVPRVIRMIGKLDVSLMERTFTEIIRRHEILRTVFPTIGGQPVQRIQPPYEFKIPVSDWSRLQKEEQEQKGIGFLVEEDRRPFDFENGPLLRVTILKLKTEEHLFILTEHHLIHDGWTQGVLLKEFITIYSAYVEGKEHGLPELPIQYADFAIWQREQLKGKVLERHLHYWKEKLAGLAPVLELPADRSRPPVISGRGDLEIVRLSGAYTFRLKEFSRKNGVTLYMTMLAVFKTLLYRYTGVEDLCVGTGVANRRYKELEGMLGMVINSLSLRTQLVGGISFKECLNRVKETCMEAYQHEDTPFGKVVEILNPERNLSYTPIFQVLFSFMDTPGEQLQLPNLELELLPAHNRSAKFDINVVVAPPQQEENEAGETLVEWEYNTDIFDAPTIQRMISHYNRLLEDGMNRPETLLAKMSLMSTEELKQVLYEFNDSHRTYPSDKTIYELFQEQASKTPDHIALGGTNYQGAFLKNRPLDPQKTFNNLTYRQLNEQSDGLTGVFIEKGVLVDDIIAIMLERSIDLIIGIMGILKSGAAYLPIDVDYPKERIDYMLNDSGAKLLVNEKFFRGSSRGAVFQKSPPGNLAYIMYTSGSTGKPKGVVVTHRNVVRLVKNTNFVPLSEETRILQTGAPVFDATTFEIWGSLLNGGQLVLADKETILDVQRLGKVLREYKVNMLWLSAPLFNQLLQQDSEFLKPLHHLLVGGDILTPEHINRVRRQFPGLKIINGYGPTENTTFSTTFEINREYKENIPIGKPIANSTAYIYDRDRQLVPVGVWGELVVSGDGVSCGYLNNPELTLEKFNRSYKSYKSDINYKTGDQARWLNDGNIEFKGRIDQLVKIRGFRVELGEIENRLAKHGEIKEVIVTVLSNDAEIENKFLCAYFTSQRELNITGLREYLKRQLPNYMIPSYFIQLEKMPLSLNGKIDRRALPLPQINPGGKYIAPSSESESQIGKIWSKILGLKEETIGVKDDFFQMGGHSLNATLLAAILSKTFHVKFRLSEIFTNPTIKEMAEVIKKKQKNNYEDIEPAEKREYYPQSAAQKRFFFLEQFENISTSCHIFSALNIEGDLDIGKLRAAIKKMIHRHEALRTSFKICNNEFVQIINEQIDFEIEYHKNISQAEIDGIIKNFLRPFDLSRAPLLRIGLCELSHRQFILLYDLHHIIGDGTSLGILLEDFFKLYADEILPPSNIQYKDFTVWQNNLFKTEELKKQEQYWVNLFSGEIPHLNLLYDFPRKPGISFQGDSYPFEMGKEISEKLNTIGLEAGATVYMNLLALLNILFYYYTSQNDIIIGTGVMGRSHAALHHIVGIFVNMLAMRNYPGGEKTYIEFLKEVKENCIKAFDNQDFQFDELIDKLKLDKSLSLSPLFDVELSLNNFESAKIDRLYLENLKITPYEFENKTTKFGLILYANEIEGGIHFYFKYSTTLFKRDTIEKFARHFIEITEQVTVNKNIKISDIILSHELVFLKHQGLEEDDGDFDF